ncbi:MAG: nucleotide exchange factor GrpE [Phycisphaerae bacterium]|nr:nucleotide exchange factor GrpE [Phycisphaerae bacterium]
MAAHHQAESRAQPHVDDRAPEPEEARDCIEALEGRVLELTAQLAEANELRLRAVADFQNFQRRMAEAEVRLLASGVVSTVRHVIPVIEHFDLALTQDPTQMNAQAAHDGLRMLRDELVKALEKAGVEPINPSAGDPFDPSLHEAIMQQPAKGAKSGQVASTFQAGYRIGDIVIRAAKVAVAP